MERLYIRDKAACARVCPPHLKDKCASYCAQAAATNASLRGKFLNVPFRQPPIADLNTGTMDEVAWEALGASYARAPWRPPSLRAAAPSSEAALSSGDVPLPPAVLNPPECPISGGLSASFYGWGQVPDALFRPSFSETPTALFERAADVNQALSGYLIDQPGPYVAPDGPLSSRAATQATSSSQLPRASPYGGIGFNLSQNTPHASLINNFGRPAYFPGSNNPQARPRQRMNNLSS